MVQKPCSAETPRSGTRVLRAGSAELEGDGRVGGPESVRRSESTSRKCGCLLTPAATSASLNTCLALSRAARHLVSPLFSRSHVPIKKSGPLQALPSASEAIDFAQLTSKLSPLTSSRPKDAAPGLFGFAENRRGWLGLVLMKEDYCTEAKRAPSRFFKHWSRCADFGDKLPIAWGPCFAEV